jgi:hypothetical protein
MPQQRKVYDVKIYQIKFCCLEQCRVHLPLFTNGQELFWQIKILEIIWYNNTFRSHVDMSEFLILLHLITFLSLCHLALDYKNVIFFSVVSKQKFLDYNPYYDF